MSKCEFCDMTLRSHLDVSIHLVSQTHRDNVKKYTDIRPERSNLRDTPSNIVQVFESLKLRTANDVKSLADKAYFRIPKDKPGILGVADKLVHILTKCIAEHRTRNLTPENRKIVLAIFDKKDVKKEPTQRPRTQSNQTQPKQTKPLEQRHKRPAANNPTQRAESERSKSPPPKRPPTTIPAPNPSRQTNPIRPVAPSTSAATSSFRITTNGSTSANTRAQSANAPSTSRAKVVEPARSRMAGLIPNATSTATRVPSAAIATNRPPTPSPRLATQTPRPPNVQDSQSFRPSPVQATSRQSVPQLNWIPRPPPSQTTANTRQPGPHLTRGPRPPNDIPPPERMPMAGASFIPWCPMTDEPPPRPRLNSNYKPVLAKIKVEPKDK